MKSINTSVLFGLFIILSILYYHFHDKTLNYKSKLYNIRSFKALCQPNNCNNRNSCEVLQSKPYTGYNKTGIILRDICITQHKGKYNLIFHHCENQTAKLEYYGFKIIPSRIKKYSYDENTYLFLVNTRFESMINIFHVFKDFLIEFFLLMKSINISLHSKKRYLL